MACREGAAASLILLAMSLHAQQQPVEAPAPGSYSLKTSVRRVVVDVVVTDSQRRPSRGLSQKDFSVEEDGKPQRILSFDVHDRDAWTGLLPSNVPANTFINLPGAPEQGPLYVLLYDMVNTGDISPIYADTSAQMFARQQLLKFIASRPQGTRFAIMAISDGLHLIQGFTSDRQQLLAALDPNGNRPHMPKVLLSSSIYQAGDAAYYLAVMKDVAHYMEGLPGRKNLVWVSSRFPFAVFAQPGIPGDLIEQVRKELAAMAASQIAIYPVDAGGVHGMNGSNLVLDEVADETGGHAFYGGNDLAGSLNEATDEGEVYYTLSYSSTNQDYDGKLRQITVKLSSNESRPGYRLAYRHQYYADPEGTVEQPLDTGAAKPSKQSGPSKQAGAISPPDTLYAFVRHGSPMSHDLLFSASVQADGLPKLATPEQMADLSEEPAYFRKRRKDRPASSLPPVSLQTYVIEYGIPSRQFRLQAATREAEQDTVEFAAAAYNAEGFLLNGNIGYATSTTRNAGKFYRAVQRFEVPLTAAWICLAVRDQATGRIGNVEFALPLAPARIP